MKCSTVVLSYFFDPTLIIMQNRKSSSTSYSKGTHYLSGALSGNGGLLAEIFTVHCLLKNSKYKQNNLSAPNGKQLRPLLMT